MPTIPLAVLAAVIGYTYYSSRKRSGPPGAPHAHGGPRGGRRPAPPLPGRPAPPPMHAAAPTWMDPGMPPDYAQSVWQALYYERDPQRLHAFGDRLHEMRMHRAGDAMHRRAEAMHGRFAGAQHWGG
jgi:hypothetical protein